MIKSNEQPLQKLALQMQSVLDKLDNLLTKVDKIDGMSSDIAAIKSDISDMNTSISAMEPRILTVENKVNNLEAQVSTLNSTQGQLNSNSIIAELRERNYRAKNVMLYNLAESNSSNEESKRQHDLDLVKKLLQNIQPNIKLDKIKTIRVGKNRPNKPRPLKLVLESDSDAIDVLREFSAEAVALIDQRFSSLRISRDRTPEEISSYQALKAELDSRTNNGEEGLKIAFRRGIPKIVKISKNE